MGTNEVVLRSQKTKQLTLFDEKRQAMLNLLIESMEKNPDVWEKGWISMNMPENGETGRKYNGINALYLHIKAQSKGYQDYRWVTFNQAKKLGANIKPKEKGSEVFYWRTYDKKTKRDFNVEDIEGLTEEERKKYIDENVCYVGRFYTVFNAEQCENFPEMKVKVGMTEEELLKQNENIETIIKNSEASVYYDGGNDAFYRPSTDTIHLPTLNSFKTKNDYYATALHEIAHSTGHPNRLNRDLKGGFGTENYAIEELRAELASVFMQSELGIDLSTAEVTNHGAYLNSWIKAIKDDSGVFYRAAADAGKIVDYIKNEYLKSNKNSQTQKVYSKEEFMNIIVTTDYYDNVNE